MKRYKLVTLVLLVAVVIVAMACAGPGELTDAQRERQKLELEQEREKLEAQRERHALWLEFWRTVTPWLEGIVILAVTAVAALVVWLAIEWVSAKAIKWRQTLVEAGQEMVYTPHRDIVLLAQRMLNPVAILRKGQEHAPAMAADEKMQMAVSIAQQAVAAKAVESPTVAFQPAVNPPRLPTGTQPLRIVGPEKVSEWVDDVRGQLAAGDVVDGQIVETDSG